MSFTYRITSLCLCQTLFHLQDFGSEASHLVCDALTPFLQTGPRISEKIINFDLVKVFQSLYARSTAHYLSTDMSSFSCSERFLSSCSRWPSCCKTSTTPLLSIIKSTLCSVSLVLQMRTRFIRQMWTEQSQYYIKLLYTMCFLVNQLGLKSFGKRIVRGFNCEIRKGCGLYFLEGLKN